MDDKEFQCALCGGTFLKGWSDAEAIEEKAENYPGVPLEDCVIICDDCAVLIDHNEDTIN